jgi:hypothetical protein
MVSEGQTIWVLAGQQPSFSPSTGGYVGRKTTFSPLINLFRFHSCCYHVALQHLATHGKYACHRHISLPTAKMHAIATYRYPRQRCMPSPHIATHGKYACDRHILSLARWEWIQYNTRWWRRIIRSDRSKRECLGPLDCGDVPASLSYSAEAIIKCSVRA